MKVNWRKYKKKRNMGIMDKKKLMADAVNFVEGIWTIHDNNVQDTIRTLHEIMYSDKFLCNITSKIASVCCGITWYHWYCNKGC